MRKRTTAFLIRLSDEELDRLNNLVRRTHLSREEVVRRLLDGAEIKEAPPADVPLLLREIKRVGNNINQILALANAKGFLDTPRLKVAMDELRSVDRLIFETYTKGG